MFLPLFRRRASRFGHTLQVLSVCAIVPCLVPPSERAFQQSARGARCAPFQTLFVRGSVAFSDVLDHACPGNSPGLGPFEEHLAEHALSRIARASPVQFTAQAARSQSGIVGPGSIVDAGCHDGVETCWLAASARDRQVHAIEPLGRNLEAMQSASWYRQLRNVHPLLGALGEKPGWLRLPARLANANVGVMLSGSNRLAAKRSDSNLTVPVFDVDSLFLSWGEQLGFAHFDVEGEELSVLRGAAKTIMHSRPLLTVEVLPHTRREQTETLLREVSGMGYSCFLLEEVCGWPVDCRNVLAIPRERAALLFQSANQIPELGGRLFEVTAESVSNHAFPCCAHGRECCPHHAKATGRTSTKASRTGGCCTGTLVSSWLARQEGRGTNGSETAFQSAILQGYAKSLQTVGRAARRARSAGARRITQGV